MLTTKRDAQRRKLLNALMRPTLERLSGNDQAWTLKRHELLTACVENWNEAEVRESFDRLFLRAAGPDRKPEPRARRARV